TKHVRDDFLAGERRERERGNELLGGARHHHLHIELFLLQAANKFGGLISCNAAGNPKRNFHRNGGGQLLPPLSVLISILGTVDGVCRLVFEQTPLQFFFGNARGLPRLRVIDKRPAAHHQLPGAPRRDHHIRKLAFRCFSRNSHKQISLQKTSEFLEFALRSAPPGNATRARSPELPVRRVRGRHLSPQNRSCCSSTSTAAPARGASRLHLPNPRRAPECGVRVPPATAEARKQQPPR